MSQNNDNNGKNVPSVNNELTVHDSFLDLEIPFRSDADTMLADVVMSGDGGNIHNATFDSVLQVMRQASPETPFTSLESSKDVFRHISAYREKQLFEKRERLLVQQGPIFSSDRRKLFKNVVLYHVCDELKKESLEEMRAHRESEGGFDDGSWKGGEAMKALQNLSLVNTEFACHVRRYGGLGYFLSISAKEPTLYKVLRNPVYGRFTRDLTIKEPAIENGRRTTFPLRKEMSAEWVFDRLDVLSPDMPALRILQLEFSDLDVMAFKPAFQPAKPAEETPFQNLRSSSLKVIRLKDFAFSFEAGADLMPELSPLALMPSLEAIHVHQSHPQAHSIPPFFKSATWVRSEDGPFEITNATIHIDTRFPSFLASMPIVSSAPILNILPTLHLSVGDDEALLLAILAECYALRTLRMRVVRISELILYRIPTLVERLKLTFEPFAAKETRMEWDAKIRDFVEDPRRGALRSLEVRLVGSPEHRAVRPIVPADFLAQPFFELRMTEASCYERKISFSLDNTFQPGYEEPSDTIDVEQAEAPSQIIPVFPVLAVSN